MDFSSWQINPALEANLKLTFPLKGQGLQQLTLSLRHEPELAYWLSVILTNNREGLKNLPAAYLKRLTEMGVLVNAEQTPRQIYWQVPHLAHDDADLLLPYSDRLATLADLPALSELMINPNCLLQPAGSPLPAEIATRLSHTHKLAPEQNLIWLEKAGSRFLNVYQYDPNDLAMMGLLHGSRQISQLSQPQLLALYRQEVIIQRGQIQQQKSDWHVSVNQAKRQMQKWGYAVLPKLIPAYQQASLRTYFRELEAEGYFQRGDAQVQARNSVYNDAVCRYLQTQLTPIINLITPEPVKPSYALLAAYQPGAILRKHKDRHQCEWNLSLVMDMDPEQEQEQAWPIYIEQANQAHAVSLEIGDAVLYRGYDVDHWRNTLAANQRVTVAFFHFVNIDFEGSLF